MNYLFTAAGRGSRFLNEGIKPPKPLIKVLGNELLIWSMDSFSFSDKDKIFIVTQKFHMVKRILEQKIKNKYPNISIFWLELDHILNGQLLTTIEAIKYFKIEGSLLVHNCDTFYKCQINEIENILKDDVFGIIPCFQGSGDNWSFAKNSKKDNSLASQITEKIRISNNCSVGTYIFSSSTLLISIFEKYFNHISKQDVREFYIAPLLQYAIEINMKVKISEAMHVKIFGTPKELLKSFGLTLNHLIGENAWDSNQLKTLVVDIDKTICDKSEFDDYSKAIPIKKVCNALRNADSQGVYIILFTSRNMKSFKGSIGLINKITAPLLINWLADYKIPYDEIYFGKPWGNSVSYIDDNNLSIEDLIEQYLD